MDDRLNEENHCICYVFGSRIDMFSVVSQSYVSNSSQSISKIQPTELYFE